MKTIQLAAMVGRSGRVIAVERDEKRYESLRKIVDAADATNTTTINLDALSLGPHDCRDVAYITVDPSCTGSGMLDRIEIENSFYKQSENRVEKLASFQIKLLKHALFHFKDVERVVYSTCSTFTRENEEVVREVVAQVKNYRLVRLDEVLKGRWFNFGSEAFGTVGRSCLYCKPEVDRTNGFFVALFERLKDGEANEYYDRNFERTEFYVREIKKERNCSDDEAAMEKEKRKKKDSDGGSSKINDERGEEIQEEYGAVTKKKKKDQLSDEDLGSQECFDVPKKKKHEKKDRDDGLAKIKEEREEEIEEYGAAAKKKKHRKKDREDGFLKIKDEREEDGAAMKKKKRKKKDREDGFSKIKHEREVEIEEESGAAMKKRKKKNDQFSHEELEGRECFDEPKNKHEKISDDGSSKIKDEHEEYGAVTKRKKKKTDQRSRNGSESRECSDEPKRKKRKRKRTPGDE